MKAKLTMNDLDKARARALSWVNRLEGISFTGYQFIFAHITNALSSVGFNIMEQVYWHSKWEGRIISYMLMYHSSLDNDCWPTGVQLRDDETNEEHIKKMHDLIVEACYNLADWIDRNGELSTE